MFEPVIMFQYIITYEYIPGLFT